MVADMPENGKLVIESTTRYVYYALPVEDGVEPELDADADRELAQHRVLADGLGRRRQPGDVTTAV